MTNFNVWKPLALRFQSLNEQPGRLHGHADSLGNHRMGFSGCVADYKHAIPKARPNSRPNDASREPGTIDFGWLQNWPHGGTRFQDVSEHRFARRRAAR